MVEASDETEFIQEHEALVRKLAIRIRNQLDLKIDVDELMAYGFQGLVEARGRFDPSRGVKFTTFAYYRIRGAILDGVRQMAYLPRRIHAKRKAAEALDRGSEEAAIQRAQNPEARAEARATLSAIDQILHRTSAAYVIAVVGQSEEDADPDPEASLLREEARKRVMVALDVLPERERKLIVGQYFEDRTLDDLGAELGMTKSWASRLCSRALLRMRRALESSE